MKNLTLKFRQSMVRRIKKTKQTVQVNTQIIRAKLLKSLEKQFEIARATEESQESMDTSPWKITGNG